MPCKSNRQPEYQCICKKIVHIINSNFMYVIFTIAIYFILMLYFIKSIHVLYFSVKKQRLTVQDQRICSATVAMFQTVLSSLNDGSITAEVLRKLNNKRDQVAKLIEAGIMSSGQTKDEISEHLSKRLKEYNYFYIYQNQLNHFCHSLDGLQILGICACTFSVLLHSFNTESLISDRFEKSGARVNKKF